MEGPIVEAPCGKLRGVTEKINNKIDFHAFKGIPYAEPPVGELRFQVSNSILHKKVIK